MNHVVVLGPDHYNTLWLVRSLGMAGLRIFVIIHTSKRESFVVKSRYCNNSVVIRDEKSILDFLHLHKSERKQVLITCSDNLAKLIDDNYESLSDNYILPNCENKSGCLSGWMHKHKMIAKAAECGLLVPDSWLFSVSGKSSNNLSDFQFPCLVKPDVSGVGSKYDFQIFQNEEGLSAVSQKVKHAQHDMLVQKYIRPDYEILLYGVSTDDEICIPGALKKIKTCTSTHNLGMGTYFCLSEELPNQISLDKIRKLIRAIGYKGLFSIEFLVSEDNVYFLEMNLRNDGTCYITTQAGVNIPAIWVYSCLNMDASGLPRTFKRKYTYGMNEVNYFKYTFRLAYIRQCIRDVARTDVFSRLKLNDMKPVLYNLYLKMFSR